MTNEMPKEILKPCDMPDVIYAMDGHFSIADGVMVGLFSNQKPINYIGRTEYRRADQLPAQDVREAVEYVQNKNGVMEADDYLQYDKHIQTLIRAATQPPVEVVTVEQFAERMRGEVVLDGQYSHCYGRDIVRVFPNGVKVEG